MQPYNPLDRVHLADSIAREFFKRELVPLPPAPFTGAGIYAIYYKGDFPLYKDYAESFRAFESAVQRQFVSSSAQQPRPLYVGKSDPPGSRKGLFAAAADPAAEADMEGDAAQNAVSELLTVSPRHRKLFERLRKHAKSISMVGNLRAEDFNCRYMLVDEIWVPLGEARLVDRFKPLWNILIEGFGSNPEGGGRKDTARSVWDILHPGRKENLRIQVAPDIEQTVVNALRDARTPEELRSAIARHREAKKAYAIAKQKNSSRSRGRRY